MLVLLMVIPVYLVWSYNPFWGKFSWNSNNTLQHSLTRFGVWVPISWGHRAAVMKSTLHSDYYIHAGINLGLGGRSRQLLPSM